MFTCIYNLPFHSSIVWLFHSTTRW